MSDDGVKRTAVLSDDRVYRYALFRTWNYLKPPAVFVGLNPSIADETEDDPTIRRCVRFARDWGYGGLVMANLYAFRATDPGKLPAGPEAIGPVNDLWLAHLSHAAGLLVAAWGAHPMAGVRARGALALLSAPYVLGLTKAGNPRHPLYMRADTRPVPWVLREC